MSEVRDRVQALHQPAPGQVRIDDVLGALEPRVEYLKERVTELQQYELGIKSLTTGSGAIDMSLHMAHDMMRILVAGFVKILDEVGGPNYVEMAFKLAGTTDRYTLTIRRPDGKTPGEVATEQRQRAEQAERERDAQIQRAEAAEHEITRVEGFCRDQRQRADAAHAYAQRLLAERDHVARSVREFDPTGHDPRVIELLNEIREGFAVVDGQREGSA